mgnify:CR=1 FL=1
MMTPAERRRQIIKIVAFEYRVAPDLIADTTNHMPSVVAARRAAIIAITQLTPHLSLERVAELFQFHYHTVRHAVRGKYPSQGARLLVVVAAE